ncbi:histidinol-phosphatase HisJ family protein [Lachnospiraceae bacterium ZAX-1]
MLWDTHMHTRFSGDSDADLDEMVQTAKKLDLKGICITDHLDLDFPDRSETFDLDIPTYIATLKTLQEKYSHILPIRIGLELGLQPHLAPQHHQLLMDYSFDFVIGSSHAVHGADTYYPEFYMGRPEEEAYMEYFTSILENLEVFDEFDVYGHIDYVVRYGPNRNKFYSYEKYSGVLDEILKTLISKKKGIELNTGGLRYGLGHPNPTEEILLRYRELGGEIITIGADAHNPAQIGYDFHKVAGILKEAGFQYYAVFKNRKPEFIKLP